MLAKEVIVFIEYADFLDIFSKKSVAVLFKCLDINKHKIDLQLGKQPCYGPIYSLSLMKLQTLKIYIETKLGNSFT